MIKQDAYAISNLLRWKVLKGPLSQGSLLTALADFAQAQSLTFQVLSAGQARLSSTSAGVNPSVMIQWNERQGSSHGMQRHHFDQDDYLEVLILREDQHGDELDWLEQLLDLLTFSLQQHSMAELAEIERSMPLLSQFTPESNAAISDWAIIFRDHFLEHSLGFLRALVYAGVPSNWIFAFDKGDKTSSRHRVKASLNAIGIRTGLLDNTTIDAPESHGLDLQRALVDVDRFIDEAKRAGRKVMVIDDGGLIACGYGAAASQCKVDAALELTISGLKRISAVAGLDIPVLNLAKSDLKQCLGYPEIADSCMRRIRSILPGHKVIGQHFFVLGYGSLGARLATALRAQGAQVHVIEADILRLIQAAENGFSTFKRLAGALSQIKPFMIAGTTGELALTPVDLPLLPDGVFLAPFATKDFSLFTHGHFALEFDLLPTIGKRYWLDPARSVIVLGDGRSMNLFNDDNIPNEGYDAYRAGTLLVANHVAAQVTAIDKGVQVELVDDIIRASGLYEAYYNRYLTHSTAVALPYAFNAVVVGYGVAGRLHARILADTGAGISIVDPKFQDLPGVDQASSIAQLPASIVDSADIWTVCSPTAEHLPSVRDILRVKQDAKILLEKPACQANEIQELLNLLGNYPNARISVINQYAKAAALHTVMGLIRQFAPESPIRRIQVIFNKDRRRDIEKGRFIDRSYGVLGYEWLHMLAVLQEIIGDKFEQYLALAPSKSIFEPKFHSALFLSALKEKTSFSMDGEECEIILESDILAPCNYAGDSHVPSAADSQQWRQHRRLPDDRVRRVIIETDGLKAVVFLDPVTTVGGWQLPRNHYRVLILSGDRILHDEIITDSPMHNAIKDGLEQLRDIESPSHMDLTPLLRISAVAEYLRPMAHSEQRVALAVG